MRLVIIGSGNVATVLAEKFLHAGHHILQVAGRSETKILNFAKRLHADAVTDLSDLRTDADFYMIAVSDDAIGTVAEKMPAVRGIVAHTAGSVSRELLNRFDSGYGVFYPLQSLKAGDDSGVLIPLLVDGNDEATIAQLKTLAEGISASVLFASDDQRRKLHLAATVVNNFSNHLYSLAYDFCRQESLPFDVLIPLIRNTVSKISSTDPRLLQTGPASRKDYGTLEKHTVLLENYPQLKALYKALSESITHSAKSS